MPDLYETVTRQGKTLHRIYNTIKCLKPDCTNCRNYHDHLDEWALKDEEGSSLFEDVSLLQNIRAYDALTSDMEGLVGPDAANELAAYKLRVKELEKKVQQLERATKKKRKRPADEEASNQPPAKQRVISNEEVQAILSSPNSDSGDLRLVWNHFHSMPRPGPQEDPLLIAQWLQYREDVDLPGIHREGPDFVVDLREVRGYSKVLSRVPHFKRGSAYHVGDHRMLCILALLRILTVPRLYSQVVENHAIRICPLPQLEECAFPQLTAMVKALNPRETATLLADRGFTLDDADDAWQFCHNFVRHHLDRDEFPKAELQRIIASEEVARASGGDPPRLHPQEEDAYRRVTLKIRSKKGKGKKAAVPASSAS